jgi:hypothetical protein
MYADGVRNFERLFCCDIEKNSINSFLTILSSFIVQFSSCATFHLIFEKISENVLVVGDFLKGFFHGHRLLSVNVRRFGASACRAYSKQFGICKEHLKKFKTSIIFQQQDSKTIKNHN